MKKYISQARKIKLAVKKGFTLIELMIVIGIIGILAVIAIPQYNSYVARAQVTEALNLLGGAKIAIADFYANNGSFPNTGQLAQIYPVLTNNAGATNANTRYVASIQSSGNRTNNFIMHARFRQNNVAPALTNGNFGGDIVIELSTPSNVANGAGSAWTCGTNLPATAYDNVPATCRRGLAA
jgi:type IV pilus assembly protein PilA